MKFRLKNQEAQSFFDAYTEDMFSNMFSKKLNERVNWVLSNGLTFTSGFTVVVAVSTSFASSVNLLISSNQIELDEE